MDFEKIDFEAIRPLSYIISPNQPIGDVYKSVVESFETFCQKKKNISYKYIYNEKAR